MEWIVFLALSVFCFVMAIISATGNSKAKSKNGKSQNSLKVLFAGVAVSAVCLFLPIYINVVGKSFGDIIVAFLISVHNTIRMFVVDVDFESVIANVTNVPRYISIGYSAMLAILLVSAPMLTFGFVLSFLRNLSAYKRYITHYNSNVYAFSELNEKSLALAESINEKGEGKNLFVFTDVFEQNEEQSFELSEKARKLGAICFKKDITAVDFTKHSKNCEISFFVIGEDQSENIHQALSLIDKFKYRENAKLYVFSTRIEAEMLLSNVFKKDLDNTKQTRETKIKVRRVNEIQSLINRTLYETGYEKIFSKAEENKNGIKEINALVVGMGQHGTEMTKALAWFCQMDGYEIRIDSFDSDEKAEDKFKSSCPELMSEKYNGKFGQKGDANYEINIHSNVDVQTKTFDDIVKSLRKPTYIFVSLGSDEENIAAAVKLRTMFAYSDENDVKPVIQAVVYNSAKKEALTGITNFQSKKYAIDFIGDIKTSYSAEVILNNDVEDQALKRHLAYGAPESAFWQYDYNYKSSVASAIHKKMKVMCGMPGIEKAVEDRNDNELWSLRKLEHRRWNAYMRTQGYSYSGSGEKVSRNDLAKKHNCLVPFDNLSDKDKEKDDD